MSRQLNHYDENTKLYRTKEQLIRRYVLYEFKTGNSIAVKETATAAPETTRTMAGKCTTRTNTFGQLRSYQFQNFIYKPKNKTYS